METFIDGSFNGCDSVVTVSLSFETLPSNGNFEYQGCTGDGFSIEIGGVTYDETNTSGTEVPAGTGSNGCDSTVSVNLTFLPNATGTLTYNGCEGDGYAATVNGMLYNESNTNGVEVISGGAANGCDSTVTIDLTFLPNATGTLTYDGCEGDGYAATVNGVVYNESNANGLEVILGGASNGCDSTVSINLNFDPVASGSESYNGCVGDGYNVVINGVTYNESNSTGMETFVDGAANGCDSVVTVNLNFNGPPSVSLANSGGSLTASSSSSGTYEWYQDDVLIGGASGSTFTATEEGTYHVVLTDGNGCEGVSNDETVVLSAVLNAVLNTSISVYPNPVKKLLTVEFSEFGTESIRMSLMDISGRELFQRDVNQTVEHINMRGYSAGVYMLKIETTDGSIAIRKVVKD